LFIISDENKRGEFVKGLIKLSQAKLPNVKIIAAMRADFFERLREFPQLVEVTQKHRPMIVEMQPSELRLAIEQPAAHHGVVFEAGLVDTIIASIQGQAGCLPLLQYTLNLLWSEKVKTGSINDRTLNISTYQNIGHVRGALQKHVDSLYKELSSSEKQAVQRIFLKLVGIGENTESGIEWKPVRRRALLSEFGDNERAVLLKLVNANLLVSNADLSGKSEKSDSTIEITHEILLNCWDELRHWIQKNRQGIALRNRLYEDVKRWKIKKPEEELWSGSKLEQILELRKDNNFHQVLGGFNDDANQFIDASVGVRDHKLRRIRIFAGVGFTLVGLTTVISVFAVFQQQEAQKQQQAVQKQSIISMTKTVESLLLNNNQLDAMVEAIKAKKELKKLWLGKDSVSMQVQGNLVQAVHHNQDGFQERLRLQGTDAVFNPTGKQLATINGKTVRVWDAKTGKLLQILTGHEDSVNRVVFSPDGERLATASDDKTVQVWNVKIGKLLHTPTEALQNPEGVILSNLERFFSNGFNCKFLPHSCKTLTGHKDGVYRVEFSPDSQRLATASGDGTARVWDAKNGKLLQTLTGHKDSVNSVEFSPDGKRLATTASDEKTARVWDAKTGKLLQTLTGHKDSVNSVEFSPDGERLATASNDTTARVWDAKGGKLLHTLTEHESKVQSVEFSPDGKRLATTALYAETARVWDAKTGKLLHTLTGHEDSVESVVFSHDGKRLVTASTDRTARVWDAKTGKELHTLTGHEDSVESVVFSHDGKRLATASTDRTARVWDAANTGKALLTLTGNEDSVKSVEYSPDGQRLATASSDTTGSIPILQK